MKTINVTVTIQMDIKDGSDETLAAGEILDLMNTIVGQSELESQPQILSNNFEVVVQEPTEEEEEVLEPTVKLTSVSGKNYFEVPESNKNTLVDMELVHYDGVKWLYFDEEWELVSEAIKNMK